MFTVLTYFRPTMEPIKDASSNKRRTRTNVKQSKFGCFTCKYESGPDPVHQNQADKRDEGKEKSNVMKQSHLVNAACPTTSPAPATRAEHHADLL